MHKALHRKRRSSRWQIAAASASVILVLTLGLVAVVLHRRGASTGTQPLTLGVQLPVAPQRPATSNEKLIGVNFGAGYENAFEALPVPEQRTAMRQVKASGIGWVRIDVPFRGPEQGWETEPLVRAALAAGLQVDALITDWSSESRPDAGRLAPFAGQAAAHYGALGVRTYEVLNEPNLASNWGGRADPVQYGHLLTAVAKDLRAAQPDAVILTGGLGSVGSGTSTGKNLDPITFLARMLPVVPRGAFDAVALHPYTFPEKPNATSPSNAFSVVPKVESLLSHAGDASKKIWVTEYGAPTSGDAGVGDGTQATMLRQAIDLNQSWPWTGPLMVFDWEDNTTDSSFGLVRSNGTPKTSLAVLSRLASTDP